VLFYIFFDQPLDIKKETYSKVILSRYQSQEKPDYWNEKAPGIDFRGLNILIGNISLLLL